MATYETPLIGANTSLFNSNLFPLCTYIAGLQGVTGPQGFTGPSMLGYTGPQGASGAEGFTGMTITFTGSTGPVGEGMTGPQGVSIAGVTGPQTSDGGLIHLKTSYLSTTINQITSCFTTDYLSYRVIVSDLQNSTSTGRNIYMRFLNGTTATTTEYTNYYINVANITLNFGTTVNQSSILLENIGNTSFSCIVIDITSPMETGPSSMLYEFIGVSSTGFGRWKTGWGFHANNVQHNGFEINGTTDSITGKVQVYAYRQ